MFRWLAYWASRVLLRSLFTVLCRFHVLRGERSAMSGGYILASNHISHFDPPVVTAACRRKIDWMAALELYSNRWVARYFNAVDTFPTDRDRVDRASVRTALNRLKMGRVVGLFPEGGIRAGTRSVLEGAPMLPGAASIAEMARVPILPCVVVGSDRLYNRESWNPFKRINIWVGFGDVIKVDETLDKPARRAKFERELAEAFRNLFVEMQTHYSMSPEDNPQTPQERMAKA